MNSLLRFTTLVIFGVLTSQNHDVNSQMLYGPKPTQSNVETTTSIVPDPLISNEGIQLLLRNLDTLCAEYLTTDTNRRYRSLETKVENLGKSIQELLEVTRNLSYDVALINVTSPVVDSSSNLVTKQAFNKGLQELKDLQTATLTSCRQYPRNCKEIRKSEKTATGNYMIKPEHAPNPFEVVCDLETRGGGWTVIQRRLDGSQHFYLASEDYKKGFGNLRGEFWLGLENIHLLTGFEMNELLIELGDFESRNTSAFYSRFSIGSEVEGYALNVLGAYSGNAGDSLTYGAGMKFTTKDYDQDKDPDRNCAQYQEGAWWYNNCAGNNMNGKYFGPGPLPMNEKPGIFWDYTRYYYDNKYTLLKNTRMLVRPKVYYNSNNN